MNTSVASANSSESTTVVVLLILVSGHVEVASAQCDSYARSSARRSGARMLRPNLAANFRFDLIAPPRMCLGYSVFL
jgi:hypothetical protein